MKIAKRSQLPGVILYICFKKKNRITLKNSAACFFGHKEQKHNFPITLHTKSKRLFVIVFVNFNYFFLLKLSAVCTFWIVLMCWCQKWFLKNKKTSLSCISARKAIWKVTATTLPNTIFSIANFTLTCTQSHCYRHM